jgi:hypothetical protein
MRNRKKLVIFLLFTSLVIACNPVIHKAQDIIQLASDVQTEQQEQTPAIPPQIRELLAYVPPEWIDQHPPEIMGSPLYYLDFDAIARDLGLPDVTSADDRKNKLPLITGIRTQGLPFGPPMIDNLSGSCYDQWGWDIADISQSLYVFSVDVSIMTGSFSAETIAFALGNKGYSSFPVDDFIFYTDAEKTHWFAVAEGIFLYASSRDTLETAIQQKSGTAANAGDLPHLGQLISLAPDLHGFVIIPSGDIEAASERYGMCRQKADWDFMIIAFQTVEETAGLDIGYVFPSESDAAKNLPIVKHFLTKTPSLMERDSTWADKMPLDEIYTDGSLVIAEATTLRKGLVGSAIVNRDYYGLLPYRKVDPNCMDEWEKNSQL